MPVYRLTPVDLNDPDWEASTHRGECRVHAADENIARWYALKEFGIATTRAPGEDIKMSPWTQANKVTAQELLDYTPVTYREGMIEVPDANHSFSSIDEVPNIDELADFDGLTPYRVVAKGSTPPTEEKSSTWDEADWGDSGSNTHPLGHDPCEICNTTAETLPATGGDFLQQDCPRCGEFRLTGTAASMLRKRRAPDFIAKLSGWVHYHQGSVPPMITNDVLEEVENSISLSITEKSHRLLLEAFQGQEKLGDTFNITDPRFIAASYSRDKDEVRTLYSFLANKGFMKTLTLGGTTEILPDGYSEAERLEKEVLQLGDAQVIEAPGFSDLFRDGFKKTPPSVSEDSNAGSGVAQTNSDSAGRDVVDHLDVTVEAENIARYISLRTLDTPMSIALFGDWGTGKSFLMNKVRAAADHIAMDAAAVHKANKECSYCNGVVQIEFNAWHYIESNLWASLTTHIFDKLNDWLDDNVEEKSVVDKLFSQLDTAREAFERAEKEKENAIYSQAHVENELVDARTNLKSKQDKLQEHTPADLWQAVKDTIANDVELSTAIKEAGKELGLDTLHQSAEDLQAVLQDAKTVGGRGHLAFTALKSQDGLYWLAGLSLVAVPIGVAAALNAIHPDGLSEGAGALAGIMATLTAWLGWGMKHARTALAKLDGFEANLNTIIYNKTKVFQKEVSEAQAAVDIARSDVELAEERLSASNQTVDALRLALQETTPQERLNAFIRNQVAKEEYTQHLGLVSTIRRDFEKLSKLMAPSNKEKADAVRVEEKVGLLSADGRPFERIILYIDDLDRCPPEKVVEVLQAIHLLLAFPLFVVVVAVDARWVARALRDHYPTLLMENVAFDLEHTGASIPGSNKDDSNGKPTTDLAASSHDYLEKIFQVPYWVKPVDVVSSQKFVDGLLALEPMGQDETESLKVVVGGEQITDQNSDVVVGPSLGGGRRRKANQQPDFDPNPVAAKISEHERKYIQVMAPSIGNSPRRLKRFVNLYRLIKAGLSQEDARAFVGDEGEALDYRAVLTNLAIVTGAPNYAPKYFKMLQKTYRKRTGPFGENFDELIEAVHPDDATTSYERARVEDALDQFSKATISDDGKKLDELRKWSRNVSRFSFTTRPE